MKKIVLLWGVILGCCACMDLPADVEEAFGAGRRKPTGIEGCAEALPAGFTEIPGCLFPDRQYALALFGR